VLTLRK